MTRCGCVPRSQRFDGTVINGVRVDAVTIEGLLSWLGDAVQCGSSHILHFCSTDPLVRARRDPDYRAALSRSSLTAFDGIGPVVAARLLRSGQATRLTGTDALAAILRNSREPQLRHYFFGGSSDVLEKLAARVTTDAGVPPVGSEAPPFRALTAEEWADAADRIRATKADVLWVGLGTPKQDYAAVRLAELGAAPVIASVGAAFDFYAGTKARAPRIFRTLGIEWLFRLVQEPRRLWKRYLIGNALFASDVARELLGQRVAS